MLKFIKKIVSDIYRGENIDLLVTVIAAIVLAILNLLGIVPANTLSAMTLALLSLFSIVLLGNRYRLEEVHGEIQTIQSHKEETIKVHRHWNTVDVRETVSSARESVVIVDSWFGDGSNLAGYLLESERLLPLEVKVYMLDPQRPFGGQRRAEFAGESNGLDDGWMEKYRIKFEDAIDTLTNRLTGLGNIELQIKRYPTLPSLRMFVVDNSEFIFSWFPIRGPSPDNPCFQVSSNSKSENIQHMVKILRQHLSYLEHISEDL